MVLLMEIEAAKTEYNESLQRLNNAEPEFLESAQLGAESARLRLNELYKVAKEDNVIPFPMVRCVPPEAEAEPEQSCPEFLFYLIKRPLEIAVGLLGIAFVLVQVGLWLGWFH